MDIKVFYKTITSFAQTLKWYILVYIILFCRLILFYLVLNNLTGINVCGMFMKQNTSNYDFSMIRFFSLENFYFIYSNLFIKLFYNLV